MGMPGTVTQIATATLRNSFRDNTVLLLTAIFLAMVLLSAWLGWSATQTINAIYAAATQALAAKGISIPPNPVSEGSALSLLRNMSIYIALLGSLAALVFGHLSIGADRKSGIIPLIATRPLSRDTLAAGKIGAIVSAIFGLTVFAAIVNVLTFLILPGLTLSSDTWIRLVGFYGASMLYMLAFALLAGVCALRFRTESMALLVPVAIWLVLTFVLPQVTANISPMAALNPLSATAALPSGSFFAATDAVLGPLSLAEAYRSLSAELLQLLPDNLPRRSITESLATIIFANAVLAIIFVLSMRRFDVSRSDFND
jgi:ABC-type transport system involved in multi-copper enzyme maturation permease subunit